MIELSPGVPWPAFEAYHLVRGGQGCMFRHMSEKGGAPVGFVIEWAGLNETLSGGF